jgi:hypothetical protein
MQINGNHRMQANYRVIFTEIVRAQVAAAGAFVDVSARCALLVEQQCRAALVTLVKETQPAGAGAGPAQPGGGSGITGVSPPSSANFYRAVAGLPRISMMLFLSRYDDLRGRRPIVRD